MIIEAIKDFIQRNCPLVSGKKIKVNCLSEKAESYTIEPVPASPIIRKYADGGSMRQYLFVFASRNYYDEDERNNIKAAEFFEKFGEWIEQVTDQNNLPELSKGYTPIRLEVLSTGYLFSADATKARYQIQCRLIYTKERDF